MNIPNTISFIRILLIPLFCFKFLNAQTMHDFLISAFILALSGISDMLDGYIARKYNMITQIGRILDPVADKLTLFAVCICFWVRNPHLWFLFGFLMIKDILIMIGSAILMSNKVTLDGSRWFGKLYTVCFYVIMLAMIIFSNMPHLVQILLMSILVLLTVSCFAMYVPVFIKLKNEKAK